MGGSGVIWVPMVRLALGRPHLFASLVDPLCLSSSRLGLVPRPVGCGVACHLAPCLTVVTAPHSSHRVIVTLCPRVVVVPGREQVGA